jgi:hypothetical protein
LFRVGNGRFNCDIRSFNGAEDVSYDTYGFKLVINDSFTEVGAVFRFEN